MEKQVQELMFKLEGKTKELNSLRGEVCAAQRGKEQAIQKLRVINENEV